MACGIRVLKNSDLRSGLALSTTVGWNQTEADWRRLLELQPDGCFCIERDGCVVSTATVIFYGSRLAWLGMVLTLPDFRGRGFATSLLQHCLDYARARGVRSIRLDATGLGRRVYERLGFCDDYAVERWQREPSPAPAAVVLPSAPGALWRTRDSEAFGADRRDLLAHLAANGESACTGQSYAFGRPGRIAAYFGPCVAERHTDAKQLAAWFIAGHSMENIFWDLCPSHPHAASLAASLGFTPVRSLMRMTLGERIETEPSPSVYALAAFEFG